MLKKHYEKIILAVLLLIFIFLLGFQIMVILRARDVEIDTVLGVKPPKPGYPRQIDFSKPEFSERQMFESEKSHWFSDPAKVGKNDICQAEPITRCPYGPHLIPVTENYEKSSLLSSPPFIFRQHSRFPSRASAHMCRQDRLTRLKHNQNTSAKHSSHRYR